MNKVMAVMIALVALAFCGEALAAQKKVLIIQSYHPELAWVVQCEKGIKDVLGAKYSLEFHYLDTKRVPQSEFQRQADAAWSIYLQLHPDLVMIGDDNGLKLLGPKLSGTTTPVVYFGINNNPRSYFETLPSNITGVLERVPVFPWLRHIQTILPNSRKGLVLFDRSPTTDSIIQVTFGERHSVDIGGIEIGYLTLGSWEAWQELVSNIDGYDFIVMPTFHALKDRSGKPVDVTEVIEWTSEHCPVPVFANQDYTVGPKGTVGSFVIFGETHGRLAAEMAQSILEGRETPDSLPPRMDKEGRFYFNQQQLDRFDLELPEKIRSKAIFQ